ncbi:RNA polymerase sigma factor [Lutibacter sp. A80]|uniref:RNA polymerase sigma factor n=1 Tax=Lutibacter sp. A80 TaxID=2918453 RepID=UPI001F06D6F4|nr:RNA polymerase sigma factor [Lutibacter sp. A80]UMB59858.1 RNA polymerase sigma factor [Lutibacter sp. A80]
MKIVQLFKNEEKLIKKAIQNNREAQQRLYNLHAPKMLSVCRYYIKDVQNAEEAMLNGFLKVFTNLNKFEHNGSFEGWIRRIMIRESISFLRKKQHIEFATQEDEFKETSINTVYSDMNVEEIQYLIDALPDGYRIVFVMYAIEGYKHHEIATLLNITEGTSKSQLYKARKILQKKIIKLNTTSNGTL